MIYPVVLGAGARLFGETSDKKPMRLVDTQAVGDGIAILASPSEMPSGRWTAPAFRTSGRPLCAGRASARAPREQQATRTAHRAHVCRAQTA